MIRINLLPLAQRRPEIPYLRVSLFFVIILAIIFGAIYAVGEYSIVAMEKDKAGMEARYEELLAVKKAMDQAGDKQKQIDAKMILVRQLEKTRTTSYNLLPRIAALLTKDIWLNESKINKEDGETFTLLGETRDYKELATFISRLEGEALFDSVTLKSTEGDLKTGTLKFTIDLKLKGSK